MKTVFVGAVESSLIALEALVQSGQPPGLVVTLPPDRRDRHSDYADLAPLARAAGSEIIFASDINSSAVIAELKKFGPDLCLVIGWSQICKQEFRDIARLGNLGFHPAPLPRFRGRAVIPWTILMNERTSGSSLFWLDKGMDSGDIVLQTLFPVSHDETAQSLYAKHTANLTTMLPQAVKLIGSGTSSRTRQNENDASYCAKRTPADGLINWNDHAENILRFVRAVGQPYPGAFSMYDGVKIIIDRAVAYAGPAKFIGLAGQIQSHTPNGFTVQCGDGKAIDVLGWRSDADRKPRIHSKLLGVPS